MWRFQQDDILPFVNILTERLFLFCSFSSFKSFFCWLRIIYLRNKINWLKEQNLCFSYSFFSYKLKYEAVSTIHFSTLQIRKQTVEHHMQIHNRSFKLEICMSFKLCTLKTPTKFSSQLSFTNFLGSQVGVVVISCASHLYDPELSPWLCTWAEICQSQSDSEGFSRGTPVFLPLQIRLSCQEEPLSN